MRRFVLVIHCLLLMFIIIPATAQDTYTWARYDFTLTVPPGWSVGEADDSHVLILGSDDAIAAFLSGQTVRSVLVSIRWVEPPQLGRDYLADFTPYSRDAEDASFGAAAWPGAMWVGEAQNAVYVARIHETFLLVATVPAETSGAIMPVLNTIIDSIQAEPYILPPAERLTTVMGVSGLSWRQPENWIAAPAGRHNEFLFTTDANRVHLAATFLPASLMIMVRDVSQLRPMLSAQSVQSLRTYFYVPENLSFFELRSTEHNGLTFIDTNYRDERVAGRAFLITTLTRAWLFVGMAGSEEWGTSEADLFDAIVATIAFEN